MNPNKSFNIMETHNEPDILWQREKNPWSTRKKALKKNRYLQMIKHFKINFKNK
jgi:hypothetical protein